MLTLTIRGLWAHKLRYALTGLAVVLGVAFMAGTMILTDTMQSTFDGVFETANDGTDVIVQSSTGIDGSFEATQERIDASVVDAVSQVDGVSAAAGSIVARTQLAFPDGTVSSEDGLGVTLGSNWIDSDGLNPFAIASGHAPQAGDEVVLDVRTIEMQDWALGDDVVVLTNVGPHTLTIVGSATVDGLDGLPGSTLVSTTTETAQALFGEAGRFDAVLVAANDGVSPDALAARITSEVMTEDVELEAITGDEDTAGKQADFAKDTKFFSTFLMAFAFISLFVGTFIIYNTFSIVVAQRVKDLAMLRAIGAKRGQVLGAVVLESVVIGLVAAAVGLVAGVGLAVGLRSALNLLDLEIPAGPLVIGTGTIVTAFAIGLLTSVLSAIVPALRASRVKPIAALRDVAFDRSATAVGRIVAGLGVTAAGVAAFVAGVSSEGPDALTLLGVGSVVVILGIFTLGPVIVRPVLRALGAPIAATGVTGSYARENARRSPKRTAATASALMIGVALVGFITILASSTTASVEAAVDKSFRADYVVDSGSWDRGFATVIEDELAVVEGIDVVSPVRSSLAEVGGSTVDISAVDTAVFDGLYDLEVSSGQLSDVVGETVAVGVERALDDGLVVGDSVPFRFADGNVVDLEIAAIYDANLANSGAHWILGLDLFEAHVADQFDRMLYVGLEDGVDASEARAAIDEALVAWPNAAVQDQAQFKQSVTEEIGMMLNLIYGLLALAVIISLIGIANTLALSVHERTRELGLLRAVGMHRRQLKRAVRWEALLISALGAALGAAMAFGGAWGIVAALDSEGVTQMVVPTTRLALIVGFAGLAGVAAATGPARRASKLDVLEALSSE